MLIYDEAHLRAVLRANIGRERSVRISDTLGAVPETGRAYRS